LLAIRSWVERLCLRGFPILIASRRNNWPSAHTFTFGKDHLPVVPCSTCGTDDSGNLIIFRPFVGDAHVATELGSKGVSVCRPPPKFEYPRVGFA
jgi:hypothetical protein